MKDLTSAEFIKSLAELKEPVAVKRYATRIGTFFPAGTEPTGGESADATILVAAQDRIVALEDEVKRLKQLLAQRDQAFTNAKPAPLDTLFPTERFGYSRPAPKTGKK